MRKACRGVVFLEVIVLMSDAAEGGGPNKIFLTFCSVIRLWPYSF